MYIEQETLDDLMYEVLQLLLERPFAINTSRGKTSELNNVLLCLKNPLARVSRTETKGKLFSALGELLWYLSKKDNLSFIRYYISAYDNESEDGNSIYGAYGPRLFNWRKRKYWYLFNKSINQVDNIICLLRERPSSRRAVIQLFDGLDLCKHHREIPCTCTLQFLLRDGRLNLNVNMRSNDAFIGLPHDVFAFTMLQEIIAKTLNVEVGSYYHVVGSLHLYETHIEKVSNYLKEGVQSTKNAMPAMPEIDPWGSINQVMIIESKLRKGIPFRYSDYKLDEYWMDIVRLLEIYSCSKKGNKERAVEIQATINSKTFNAYIDPKTIK